MASLVPNVTSLAHLSEDLLSSRFFDDEIGQDCRKQVDDIVTTMHSPRIDWLPRRAVLLRRAMSHLCFEVCPELMKPADNRFVSHGDFDAPVLVEEWDRSISVNQSSYVTADGDIVRNQQSGTAIRRWNVPESTLEQPAQGRLVDVCFISDLPDRRSALNTLIGQSQILNRPLQQTIRSIRVPVTLTSPAADSTEPLFDNADERTPTSDARLMLDTPIAHSNHCISQEVK